MTNQPLEPGDTIYLDNLIEALLKAVSSTPTTTRKVAKVEAARADLTSLGKGTPDTDGKLT